MLPLGCSCILCCLWKEFWENCVTLAEILNLEIFPTANYVSLSGFWHTEISPSKYYMYAKTTYLSLIHFTTFISCLIIWFILPDHIHNTLSSIKINVTCRYIHCSFTVLVFPALWCKYTWCWLCLLHMQCLAPIIWNKREGIQRHRKER